MSRLPMPQSLLICWIVIALMCASFSAHAEDVGPGELVEFTAGTRARASEVNANFDRLAEVVNSKQDEDEFPRFFRDTNGELIVGLAANGTRGLVGAEDAAGSGFARLAVASNGHGGVQTADAAGQLMVEIDAENSDPSKGRIGVYHAGRPAEIELGIAPPGSGVITTKDFNGRNLISLTHSGDDASEGFMAIANGTDSAAVFLSSQSGTTGGNIDLLDASNRFRLSLDANPASIQGFFDSGLISFRVGGPDGSLLATGPKSFVHPNRADPTTQIVFVALEGPEAGTYFRGTTALRSGSAEIPIPESWQLVTEEEGITIQVTPRGDCLGLYADVVSRDLIVVRELGGGTSDVVFDYTVNGVRDGFAQHAVIQPNTMFLPENSIQPEELGSGIGPALIESGIVSKAGEVNRKLVEQLKTYKQRPDFSDIPYIDPDGGRSERSAE